MFDEVILYIWTLSSLLARVNINSVQSFHNFFIIVKYKSEQTKLWHRNVIWSKPFIMIDIILFGNLKSYDYHTITIIGNVIQSVLVKCC